MKLLHIVATPREQMSNTLKISSTFIKELAAKNEDLVQETLNLFDSDLPAAAGDNIEAKYHLIAGLAIDARHQESWNQIEALIQHFLSADLYVISAPMWNFSVPYTLKYYIDCIVQPGYLFRYNEQGQAEGLVNGKKMVCVTSRGGNYAPGSPFHAFDFEEPYLRALFGFVGITDMHFINANMMDITPELRESSIQNAIESAKRLAANNDWFPNVASEPVQNPEGLKPPTLEP